MAKAFLKIPNGPSVTLEGTPEEVKQLLQLYSENPLPSDKPAVSERHRLGVHKAAIKLPEEKATDAGFDLNQIVTLAKDCDEAEAIEKQILDRTAQVDRTLLPLYIVHEYLSNEFWLTSGDINRITTDLGIPISQPNASRALSGTGSKYVIGDKVKVKGKPVRYKLSRRGVRYMKEVLAGNSNG
ncbi:MAG: hypothetical protein H8K03_02510 [Nitrospira sp.]